MNKELANELKIYASDLNILIVEDDLEIQTQLASLLKYFFHKVTVANNGQEGIDKYKSNRFDLILTDISMPVMNGIEFSREVRILNKEQVILVLSGYIDTFVIDLIDIGVQGLILKPYDMDKFFQVLCKQCENVQLSKEFKRATFKALNKNVISKKEEVQKGAKTIVEKKANLEKDILKNHQHSASKYAEDERMWVHILSDVEDLNFRFNEVIEYIMLNGIKQTYCDQLSDIFNKYYTVISLLNNLEDFAKIFEDLSVIFIDIDLPSLQPDQVPSFEMLGFIYDDLINFFDVVFISKEARDINYLTDSLRSSVKQLRHNVGLSNFDDEELELF